MTRLSDIRARIAAATPGPWCADDHVQKVGDLGEDWGVFEQCEDDPPVIRCINWHQKDNAYFIAHARADIPHLLATIDELANALRGMVHHFGVLEYNDMMHPTAVAASKAARAALKGLDT